MTASPETSILRNGTQVVHLFGAPNQHINATETVGINKCLQTGCIAANQFQRDFVSREFLTNRTRSLVGRVAQARLSIEKFKNGSRGDILGDGRRQQNFCPLQVFLRAGVGHGRRQLKRFDRRPRFRWEVDRD